MSYSIKGETFQLPEQLTNEDGEERKAGFELEFAGLALGDVAQFVVEVFGGESLDSDPFHRRITGARFGEFSVELDAHFLKKKVYARYLDKLGIDINEYINQGELEKFLGDAAALVVPIEVVTPPIPFSELDQLEKLRDVLLQNRAKGTRESFFYAFGLHINPEVPSLKIESLLRYLRSFLLLYEWMAEETDVDLTRWMTPYISPFKDEYIELVLQPDYRPDSVAFITDYLRLNPTRNRPLDLTPIMACIDEERVLKMVQEKELISKRPAYHYRLPNCLIDQRDWSIAHEWNIWAAVEYVAADPQLIEEMSREYLKTKASLLEFFVREWPAKVRKCLE